MVLFLAAALAFAACTRTARRVSSLIPEEVPALKGTKATPVGWLLIKGSWRSSLGDGSGLLDVVLGCGSGFPCGRCMDVAVVVVEFNVRVEPE